MQRDISMRRGLFGLVLILFLLMFGCEKSKSAAMSEPNPVPLILRESWNAYVQQFIQQDGRVIDHSAANISTSEGQAYAMLRAVWIGDRENFDKTFTWAKNNLNSGIRKDNLWAWKWGKNAQGKWVVLDKAFAADADQDAALALILASRVWKEAKYAEDARAILRDLWMVGTVEAGGHRYLLAGDSSCKREVCRINPSYYAPYAYRIFAGFDDIADWDALVESSYQLLNIVSGFANTGLPADWVQLNTMTGEIAPASEKDSAYSYDAFRVHWRIEVDRELFRDPRADQYLRDSLTWVEAEWNANKKLPAVISPAGKGLADYESLEMVSALMCATHNEAMQAKLSSAYSKGIWGEKNRYYLQNWAWFGTAVYNGYFGPFELVKPKV
jgi:endo-1,4-beta-D-glucanase Y